MAGTKNATNFTKNAENDRVKEGQIRVIRGCLFGLLLKLTALGPTPAEKAEGTQRGFWGNEPNHEDFSPIAGR